MSLFDSKEEVIELVLTGYGKHKLSIGEFDPEFYAFYDDGILYDITYANGSEGQNDIEPRITTNTPYLKPQPYYHGVETEYKKFHKAVKDEKMMEKKPFVSPPVVAREHNLFQNMIGSIDTDVDRTPDISIQCLTENILSASVAYTGSFTTNLIPQIELNPEHSVRALTVSELVRRQEEINADPFGIDQDFVITGFKFGQGVLVGEEEIILQVSEDGIDTSGNNFMLELFSIDDATGIETLLPLKFKPTDKINRINANENFSEFFFDIEVDDEIPSAVLCKNLRQLELNRKNITLNKKVDCSQFDSINAKFNIYGDVKQEPENC